MAREFVTVSRSEREYIPKDWYDEKGKPEKGALTFKFKPLSKRQLAEYTDNSSRVSLSSNVLILGTNSVNIDIFKSTISGWSGLIIDGKEYPFRLEIGAIPEEVIDAIDMDIINEVANHIVTVSKFPKETLGK